MTARPVAPARARLRVAVRIPAVFAVSAVLFEGILALTDLDLRGIGACV
jgi:hypothetical protein